MKQTSIDSQEEPMYDIVNLCESDTGIKGTIRCSTKMAQYGCGIKFFPNLKIKSESLSVSIPDGGIVEDTTNVDNLTKKMVVYFAKKNAEIFLKLWNDGTSMYQEELQEEIWDKIKPIEPCDLQQIKQITIINGN